MSWKDDLNYGLAAFGVQIPERLAIDEWSARLSEKPMTNSLYLVGVAAGLFYVAEKDYNPRVNSIHDALIYCSTCLSVGYHNIFPRTPIGKLIGTALMTVGPALAARALDGPQASRESSDALQKNILSTLQDIAQQLKAKQAG